jgi:hypothetical protein
MRNSAGGFNEFLKRNGSTHPHLNKLVEFVVASVTGALVSIIAISTDQQMCYISIGLCG